VTVDYQSTGTAVGVSDFIEGRVDFAGSDLPLTKAQAAKVPGGIRQLPMAGGAIVAVYNLDGVPDLKLSRAALLGIFSGSIARWNDPAIAATNPDAALPDLHITVVGRSDASGTSYKFTRYLSAISGAFAEEVGTSMSPNWPKPLKQRGGLLRGRGNGGVAASVRAIPGSIGYVQYAFAALPGISIAALENRAGKIVTPDAASFGAALDAIGTDSTIESATDPAGADAYPIVGLSWLVLRNEYEDPAKLPTLKDLIGYAMGPGQDVVMQLGYIPFPEPVIAYVKARLQ
jgi:phosphate transport system substrate-binding protein